MRILLRADSGFCRSTLMSWCEANRIDYVFDLARNARLAAEISIDLAAAEAESTATGKPAHRLRHNGSRLGKRTQAPASLDAD